MLLNNIRIFIVNASISIINSEPIIAGNHFMEDKIFSNNENNNIILQLKVELTSFDYQYMITQLSKEIYRQVQANSQQPSFS